MPWRDRQPAAFGADLDLVISGADDAPLTGAEDMPIRVSAGV
jgi:hypothetical protein